MSLAAVPEGLILGGLQARGIKWFYPGVSSVRWVLATIVVGLVGWGIGTFIPLFMVDATAVAHGAEPSLADAALFSSVFGLPVGAIFGLAQGWAFPAGARQKGLWVASNAVGWAIALPWIYSAAQIAADQGDWLLRIVLWACGGLGAGMSIGIVTGIGLSLMTRRDSAARTRIV